ncbi:MAG TPA: hypothetical protein VMT82_00385 [candidate division Zixibacteria bacterium]|nr:hypothetical protein [candidate division Zixibacteria bacterium]
MSKQNRIILLAVIVVLLLAVAGLNFYRVTDVQTHLSSAQVYWQDNQAIITVSTINEVRDESYLRLLLSMVGAMPPVSTVPQIGPAKVIVSKADGWDVIQLPKELAPKQFELWPFNSKFYTLEEGKSREWTGRALGPAPASVAGELRRSFPSDPNNYVPAGPKGSGQPYAVLQDVITRAEWHAYTGLANAQTSNLPFELGGRKFTMKVQRSGDVRLAVEGDKSAVTVWEPTKPLHTAVLKLSVN